MLSETRAASKPACRTGGSCASPPAGVLSAVAPGEAPLSTTPEPAKRAARGGGWTLLLLALLVVWSLQSSGVDFGALLQGRDEGWRLVQGFLRPDLSGEFLSRVGWAIMETIQISIASLFLATLLAAPLALLIAKNVAAPAFLRCAARYLASSMRATPELLLALVFVATVGLGPAAGVFAIALHGGGLLAKLWAEQFEGVDPSPIEAMRLTGGSRSAIALLAVIPAARNGLASLVLYQWECNIRTAVVVGFVGAGGIGEALLIALRLFRYNELSTLLIAVVGLTICVDFISRTARRRLGAAA